MPITSIIRSKRLTTRMLISGDLSANESIIFLHGNISNADYWGSVLDHMIPGRYCGIAYDQRGFGDADHTKIIEARKGVEDWVQDLISIADELNIQKFHLAVHSLGGIVAFGAMGLYPERLKSVVLVAPGPPYGYGGCKGKTGDLVWPDGAGSGAGLINQRLAERIREQDRSIEHSSSSPRHILSQYLFHSSRVGMPIDMCLDACFSTHQGERAYPGDWTESVNWPFKAPGNFGPVNAISSLYNRWVTAAMMESELEIPTLWIRGDADALVSDAALSDAGNLGKLGMIPGWPGEAIFPPQLMIQQTRFVLSSYHNEHPVREAVMNNVGHCPYLENPDEFKQLVQDFWSELSE